MDSWFVVMGYQKWKQPLLTRKMPQTDGIMLCYEQKQHKCELKIDQNLIKSSKAKCVMMRGLGFACLSVEEIIIAALLGDSESICFLIRAFYYYYYYSFISLSLTAVTSQIHQI